MALTQNFLSHKSSYQLSLDSDTVVAGKDIEAPRNEKGLLFADSAQWVCP